MNNINTLWTDEQITLALHLYTVTPYSKISPKNPEVIDLANLLGRSPGAISLKLSNLAACDQKGLALGHKGSSHGSKLDAFVWKKYLSNNELDIEKLNRDAEKIRQRLLNTKISHQPTGSLEIDLDIRSLRDQERYYTMKARLDQSLFRRAVLANFNSRCPFSDCAIPELIDAAHILPWNDYPKIRMKLSNGLLLNKLIHIAFDKNMLGIDPNGQIVLSKFLLKKVAGGPCQQFFSLIKNHRLDFNQLRCQPNKDYLHERFKSFQEAQK